MNQICCSGDAENGEIKDMQLNFIGDIESRIKMRTDIINSIQFNEYDENMYDEFLERLINMEEDLVEENG